MTKNPPPHWSEDKLSEFFDLARDNTFASFVRLRSHYAKIVDIDSAFLSIGKNLLNPPDRVAPFFLFKSHSSLRAAVSLGMGGQSAEAFIVMRGTIESALYAIYLGRTAGALDTYMSRHDDDASRKAVRNEFTMGRMWKCLRDTDEKLQREAQAIYDKTIDFGAHPNVAALITATTVSRTPDYAQFKLLYLTADPTIIGGTLKSAAQAGVIALEIFRYIFKERYDLLGLTPRLQTLRQGL
jgi:hypothetical protein